MLHQSRGKGSADLTSAVSLRTRNSRRLRETLLRWFPPEINLWTMCLRVA